MVVCRHGCWLHGLIFKVWLVALKRWLNGLDFNVRGGCVAFCLWYIVCRIIIVIQIIFWYFSTVMVLHDHRVRNILIACDGIYSLCAEQLINLLILFCELTPR